MTSRIAQAGTYGIHCTGVHNVRQLFTGPLQFERQKFFKVIVQRQKFDHLTTLNDFTDFHIAFRQFCRQFRLANQHDGQQFLKPDSSSKKRLRCFSVGMGRLWASSITRTWLNPAWLLSFRTRCNWRKRAS